MLKSIALALVLCLFAVDALRLGDIPDVIVSQIRKHLNPSAVVSHGEQQKPAVPVTEKEKHHQPSSVHHHNNNPNKPHPHPHHTEIIDEKERIYLVPKKDQPGTKKIDDQVVVLEKETIRRVIDDNDPKYIEEDEDEWPYDEKDHESHFGQSVFKEMQREHGGDEFCGGKPGEEPEEPEIIQEVNNFDAIADAILERRLSRNEFEDDMEEDDFEEELHPHDEHYEGEKPLKKTVEHTKPSDGHHSSKKTVAKPKPSHLTADEAKLWNKKLSEAIKNRRQKVIQEEQKKTKIVNHLVEDLKL